MPLPDIFWDDPLDAPEPSYRGVAYLLSFRNIHLPGLSKQALTGDFQRAKDWFNVDVHLEAHFLCNGFVGDQIAKGTHLADVVKLGWSPENPKWLLMMTSNSEYWDLQPMEPWRGGYAAT